jgi:DNA polymerase III subunit gamma/tau
LCEGGLRDALQLLAQARLLGEEVTASQVIELAGGIAEADILAMLQAIAASDTFQLLQSARNLMDAGKSPKLILNSLLQTYRDLLIVQSAPNQRHLLTSSVSSDQLQAIAQRWSYETIQAGLAQLHTSEGQLRFSPNAQVWLEVCLLNLLPRLTSKLKAFSPPELTVHQNNGSGQMAAKKLWEKVIDRAPDNAKRFLSRARMQSFKDNRAVLAVEEQYLERFEANALKISHMVQKVVGGNKPVELELRATATAVL